MTADQQPSTPPTNHKAVNQWMLGNGWRWVDRNGPRVREGAGSWTGYWTKSKPGCEKVSQDLAAEMWRMAERMCREQILLLKGAQEKFGRIDFDQALYELSDRKIINSEHILLTRIIERWEAGAGKDDEGDFTMYLHNLLTHQAGEQSK